MLGRFRGLIAVHEKNARLREELATVRRELRNTEGSGDAYPAEPGGWREDLTKEQAQIVEEVTAPFLKRFYSET